MGAQDQRPRFYEGQYLSAEDLAAIVEYLRAADARHALGAHTWGIAAGLQLTERPAPGEADRVEVTLQPGLAWDGFGRPLLVTQPTRLPESLFEKIEPNPIVDNPPPPALPTGRLLKVWLGYKEIGARQPAPGFESCLADDQTARVREAFEFYIGEFAPGPESRSPVSIGAVSVDAQQALLRFDPQADPLWDASVPHQSFPLEARPPRRWLVPIGYVRWVAREGAPGCFLKRDKVAADQVEDRIRAFRINVGTVAEYIESAAGVILLHRRGEQRDIAHRFLGLLKAGRSGAELLQDLVWVEGNLRVEGDAKLAGGRLLLRDLDGLDQGTPLYLARTGDQPGGAAGNRELRAVIGPDGQADNRFVVGREGPGAPTPAISPNLVVTSGDVASGGNVGVNVAAPDSKLHIRSANAQQGELRIFSAGNEFEYDGGADKLFTFKDSADGKTAFMGTRLGVGTAAPRPRLEVAGAADQWGTAAFVPDPAKGARVSHVHWDVNGDWYIRSGTEAGKVVLQDGGGNVGVGTANPVRKLHVQGDRVRLENAGKRIDLRADGSAVDLHSETHKLYIQSTAPGGQNHVVINPHAANGNVGIGTASPRPRLEVAGAADQWGTAAFVPDPAKGARVSHVHWDPNGDWYIRSAAAAGKVILQDGGGNVGVGTANPAEKLHVAGSFLRVDGVGNEQAYIGGDGSVNVYGRDVQIGSTRANLSEVHLWNRADGDWMWLTCQGVDIASDARRKTNIEPLSGALDKVTRLRGVRFEWKRPQGSETPPRRGLGVIAQEVADVAPELVTSVRGDLAVSYHELVPLLIEAIKELKAEVDELRAQLAKTPKKDKRPRDRD